MRPATDPNVLISARCKDFENGDLDAAEAKCLEVLGVGGRIRRR